MRYTYTETTDVASHARGLRWADKAPVRGWALEWAMNVLRSHGWY